jgi:hypothetical protein
LDRPRGAFLLAHDSASFQFFLVSSVIAPRWCRMAVIESLQYFSPTPYWVEADLAWTLRIVYRRFIWTCSLLSRTGLFLPALALRFRQTAFETLLHQVDHQEPRTKMRAAILFSIWSLTIPATCLTVHLDDKLPTLDNLKLETRAAATPCIDGMCHPRLKCVAEKGKPLGGSGGICVTNPKGPTCYAANRKFRLSASPLLRRCFRPDISPSRYQKRRSMQG